MANNTILKEVQVEANGEYILYNYDKQKQYNLTVGYPTSESKSWKIPYIDDMLKEELLVAKMDLENILEFVNSTLENRNPSFSRTIKID